LRFEWDDAKAISNVEKHGITFGEATEVFYDPNALEGHDTEHSGNEDRFSSSAIPLIICCSSFLPSASAM
jgi:uncharacterized DUF497 family protein